MLLKEKKTTHIVLMFYKREGRKGTRTLYQNIKVIFFVLAYYDGKTCIDFISLKLCK